MDAPQTNTARSAEDTAALMAELEAIDEDGNLPEPEEEEDADAEESDEEEDDDSEDEEEGEESDEEEDDEEEDSEDDDSEDDSEDTKPDDDTEKRLEKIRAEEKRARTAISAERAELDKARTAHEADIAEVKEFKALKARVRFEPLAVLMALGMTEDDLAPASKQLYFASPGAKSDPKNREAVEQHQRTRQHGSDLEALREQNAALTKRIDDREASETQQREADAFIGTITSAVTDTSPIASALMEKDPAHARQRLVATAMELINETGEKPEPAEVLKRYEADGWNAKDLRIAGIDPPRAGKKKASTKTKPSTKKAKKTKKAKTKKKDDETTPTVGHPTREEMLSEKWPGEDD